MIRRPGWQTARADYLEEQERYGLEVSWEDEMAEEDTRMDRLFDKADWRVHELWGV